MKRHIIPCILSLTLLLTACGGEQAAADTAEEAVKDHYYQILDAAGKELYTEAALNAVWCSDSPNEPNCPMFATVIVSTAAKNMPRNQRSSSLCVTSPILRIKI